MNLPAELLSLFDPASAIITSSQKRKGYISDPPVIAIPSSRQNSRPDI
jgi:hypothetical protein